MLKWTFCTHYHHGHEIHHYESWPTSSSQFGVCLTFVDKYIYVYIHCFYHIAKHDIWYINLHENSWVGWGWWVFRVGSSSSLLTWQHQTRLQVTWGKLETWKLSKYSWTDLLLFPNKKDIENYWISTSINKPLRTIQTPICLYTLYPLSHCLLSLLRHTLFAPFTYYGTFVYITFHAPSPSLLHLSPLSSGILCLLSLLYILCLLFILSLICLLWLLCLHCMEWGDNIL